MLKKAGPPVPPRPNAVLVANALAKSRGGGNLPPASSGPSDHHSHRQQIPLAGNSVQVLPPPSNTILIRSNSNVGGNTQRMIPGDDHQQQHQPVLQLETYTKSPSMTRSKRILVQHEGNSSAAARNDDSPATTHRQQPLRPVPRARAGAGGVKVADLIGNSNSSSRPKNIISLETNLSTASTLDVVTTTSRSSSSTFSGGRTVVVTTLGHGAGDSPIHPKNSAAGVNGSRNRAAEDEQRDHHTHNHRNNLHDYTRQCQSPVRVPRDRSNQGHITTTTNDHSNHVEDSSFVPRAHSDCSDRAVTHRPCNQQPMLQSSANNLPSNRSTIATLAAADTENSGDVIVVGGTTSQVRREPRNCNRIEIKAEELPSQNENLWRQSTRTTLLIRSGSSASSDSSSSSSGSSAAYHHAAVTATASSKSMAQQRTEITINHSSPAAENGCVHFEGGASLAGVARPEPEGGEAEEVSVCAVTEHRHSHRTDVPKTAATTTGKPLLDKLPKERKVAFHEKLISELAAMHHRGQSPEDVNGQQSQSHSPAAAEPTETEEVDLSDHHQTRRRRSIESPERLSASPNGSQGSQRSRIRTADWIEVGDNGKQEVFSSCQISLEDSGLEDEMERLEETSSSGAGDSWDSVIDHEER